MTNAKSKSSIHTAQDKPISDYSGHYDMAANRVFNVYDIAFIKARWKWILALFVCAALAGYGYNKFIRAPRILAEKEAFENATSNIEREFAKWSSTTIEDDKALAWSGASSKVIYIGYSPAFKDRFGQGYQQNWSVWAKTESGRMYVVRYYLNENLEFEADSRPEPVTEAALVRALVNDKRIDLIHKLHLPINPA